MQFNSLQWNLMQVNVAPALGAGGDCCFTFLIAEFCSMKSA